MVTTPGQRRLTAGLVLTIVSVAFEGLAVTTVMPTAVRELGGLATYGWTFSAFMLANVIGITMAGQHTDRGGPLRPFAAGLVLFGLGLAGGGAAPSMPVLIAARAVQGLGGGALSAVVYACVARAYAAEQQPRMLALLSTAWVVPGLVGPGVSGLVADRLTWRLVFLGLIPLLPVAAVLTLPALRGRARAPAAAAPAPAPIASAVLLATGSAMALLGLQGTAPLRTAVLVVLGASIAVPNLRRLVPAGTLSVRAGLPAAIVSMALVSVAFFGAETVFPLLVTVLREQSATTAGLALSGATFTWTAGAWVQARQARRRRRRTLVGTGAALIACGIVGVTLLLGPTVPVLVGGLAWAIAGLGMGVAHATISLTVIEQAAAGEEGSASAAMQLANALGVALGAGIGGAAVALGQARAWAPTTGFGLAFAAMLAAALATLAVSRRLP